MSARTSVLADVPSLMWNKALFRLHKSQSEKAHAPHQAHLKNAASDTSEGVLTSPAPDMPTVQGLERARARDTLITCP